MYNTSMPSHDTNGWVCTTTHMHMLKLCPCSCTLLGLQKLECVFINRSHCELPEYPINSGNGIIIPSNLAFLTCAAVWNSSGRPSGVHEG